MNVKTVMALVLACGVVVLSGCASMKSKDSSAMAPADNSNFTVDDNYVARVNHVARENGVTVVWVNPPDKPRHN